MPRAFGSGFGSGFGGPINVGSLMLHVGAFGPDPMYQDGDIVVACNRRRTRHAHAEMICHPRKAQRTSDGFIDASHHCRDWFEQTYRFRMDRVSATEVLRTDLVLGGSDLLSDTPNQKGERIDVREYLARRKASATYPLFGAPGTESWYGGTIRSDNATLDRVWSAIETKTPLREVDHDVWPFTDHELRHFLILHTDDFTDAESESLVAPEEDTTNPDAPVIVRKRRHHVPWRSLRDMSAARIQQIEDRSQLIDIRRERKIVRAVAVVVK